MNTQFLPCCTWPVSVAMVKSSHLRHSLFETEFAQSCHSSLAYALIFQFCALWSNNSSCFARVLVSDCIQRSKIFNQCILDEIPHKCWAMNVMVVSLNLLPLTCINWNSFLFYSSQNKWLICLGCDCWVFLSAGW